MSEPSNVFYRATLRIERVEPVVDEKNYSRDQSRTLAEVGLIAPSPDAVARWVATHAGTLVAQFEDGAAR